MRPRLLVALIVAVLVSGTSCASEGDSDVEVPAGPEGTQTYTDLTFQHVDAFVEYPQTPPVGGDHWSVWQTCAVYDQPVQPELAVHSMEHGAVWITYAPDLDASQVDVLVALAEAGDKVLLSPFEGLPSPVVASAWGKQVVLGSATDRRLAEFLAAFDNGPQAREPNGPCTDGITATPP